MAPMPARTLLFLTLMTPTAASQDDSTCKAGSCEEPLSLLQSNLLKSVHRGASSLTTAQGDCACLNWKETYQSEMSHCGQSNEYFAMKEDHDASGIDNAELMRISEAIGQDHDIRTEYCHNFFELLDTNICVNVNVGSDHGQWCYVSTACAEGTQVPKEQVSWKSCTADDTQLRNIPLTELKNFTERFDLDLGLVSKMAYPMSRYQWSDVSLFFEGDSADLSQVPVFLRDEMQAIVDSGAPITFSTNFTSSNHYDHILGLSPYRIIKNTSVYDVYPRQNKLMCQRGCSR